VRKTPYFSPDANYCAFNRVFIVLCDSKFETPALHIPAQDIQRDLARMGIKDLLKSLEGATIQVVVQFSVKPI
jgi:hypothetical protein